MDRNNERDFFGAGQKGDDVVRPLKVDDVCSDVSFSYGFP